MTSESDKAKNATDGKSEALKIVEKLIRDKETYERKLRQKQSVKNEVDKDKKPN